MTLTEAKVISSILLCLIYFDCQHTSPSIEVKTELAILPSANFRQRSPVLSPPRCEFERTLPRAAKTGLSMDHFHVTRAGFGFRGWRQVEEKKSVFYSKMLLALQLLEVKKKRTNECIIYSQILNI